MTQKTLLIIYHSQGGTVAQLAQGFARGASREESVRVLLKKAGETTLDDLLDCDAIAIGSPEYFGTMAGMIKDFFDRTYEAAKEQTMRLPYVVFVAAGNDGRGALQQIDRIAAGYQWQKVQPHFRITGTVTEEDLANVETLGQTLAAGLDFGIF